MCGRLGDYSVGEHTLWATLTGVGNVTEGNTSADVRVELTLAPLDAEILSIASNPANTAVQGQPVEILVQVRNNGPVAIPVPIELTFPSPDKAPERRSPRVLPGATETAYFVWKTGDYSVGEHTLWATLTGVDNVTEGSTSADVRVELTLAPVDAEILSITSNPADTAVQGQPVEILVQVRNNGPVAIPVPIELTFPSADKAPERRSPRVLPGATETVNFVWKTGDYSVGEQTLRAALIGVGNVTEGNTSADVRVELTLAPLDAEILSIASNPANTAVQGQPVEILVQVRNNGPVAIPVPIELTFPSADKAPELRSPRVLPGATETVNFVWKTGDYSVGEHTLWAALTGVGNVTEGSTSADVRVELTTAPVDAEILSITSNPANTAVQGQPVEILVQVRNNGPVAIPVPIELTFPSPDKAPELRSPRVLPGATETVNFVWKTGDYSVGEHTLWAALTGVGNVTEGSTSADVRVELTTAPVDAEILSITSNPANTAVQGQPVEILVQVRNNGRAAINVPVELTFPSADKAPERRSPRVAAGGQATAAFVWSTGNYPVGVHTLRAALVSDGNITTGRTADDVQVELTVAPLAATITKVWSTPDAPMVGTPVEIMVAVRNDGPVGVNVPITLHYPSAGKQPETRRPRVGSGETGLATFEYLTGNYRPGTHSFRVVIGSDESAEQVYELTLLLPPLDVEILSITSNPANTAVQGQPVEILVQVRNNGRAAINVPVELTFPSADKAPERRSPRVDAGGQATAAFVWNTGNYPVGVHTLRAELVSAGNHTAGKTAADVEVELTVAPLAATITRVWSTPDAPMVGTPVAIMVAVRNDGPVGVNVPITLHYPSAGKQPETRRPRVGSGETGLATFEWLTGNYRPGTHSFRVVIGSDVSAERVFELMLAQALLDRGAAVRVELARAPLAAAITNISSTPDAPMVGTPVEITVAVRNDGPLAVNVPVTLHYPSADKQPETRRPRVAPGETALARFEWRTSRYTPGTHAFRVIIPSESPGDPPLASQVFNLVLLAPLADFAVENITVPDIGRPFVQGEWIPIAALVRNLGPSQGRGTLTLEDATDATHLAEMYQRSITLEPGESRRVEFTWKSLRYDPGVRHLRIVADGDYDPTHHNNRTQLATVALLPNQDIIIGFGDDSADALVFKDASPPALQTTGDALDRIVALSAASYQAQTFAAPELGSPILAAHVAVAGRNFADTAQVVLAMHRLHQAAYQSAHHCSDLQRRLDNSHPRAVLCPAAPALLR